MRVEERLDVLERRCRRLRMFLIALLVAIASAFMLAASTQTGVIRASKIVIPKTSQGSYDAHVLTFEAEGGQRLAKFQLHGHGPALWIYDNTGRHVLSIGASANDYGGHVNVKGKPEEDVYTLINGRGLSIMGRPVSRGRGPWASLVRLPEKYNQLIIRGPGTEAITLDNRQGEPRIEITDSDGKVTSMAPSK